MKSMRPLALAVLCVAVLAVMAPLASAQLSIEKVVSTNAAYSGFTFTSIDPFPGLNNNGQVVFAAEYDDAGTTRQGIFRADTNLPGSPVVKLLDNSGAYDNFMTNTSFINDSGVIASRASRDDGDAEVITLDSVGGLTTVASTAGAFDVLGGPPGINNAGMVTFSASLDSDGTTSITGIYKASPPAAATPVETVADGAFDAFFLPIVNAGGDILYFGSNAVGTGGTLVREATGGAQTPIATTDPAGPNTQALPYDLNDLGDAAYVGRDFATSDRSIRVYDESTGLTTLFAQASDGFDFSLVPEVAINDNGRVVFSQGNDAIFYGANPATDAVVQVGDSLFGDSVYLVALGKALNDNDQLAFLYALDNGEVGIALVTVPEPSGATLALAAVALTGLHWRRNSDNTPAAPGRGRGHFVA